MELWLINMNNMNKTRVIQSWIYQEQVLRSFTRQDNFQYLYFLAGGDTVRWGLEWPSIIKHKISLCCFVWPAALCWLLPTPSDKVQGSFSHLGGGTVPQNCMQPSALLGGHRGGTQWGSQSTAVPSDLEPPYFPLNWCCCAVLFCSSMVLQKIQGHTVNLLPAALISGWSPGPAEPRGGNPVPLRYDAVQSSRNIPNPPSPTFTKRWLQR